jgi:hypothetical protein
MVLLNNRSRDWVIPAASTSQSCELVGARIGNRVIIACICQPAHSAISTPSLQKKQYTTLKFLCSTINRLPLKNMRLIVSWNEGSGLEEPLKTKRVKHGITRDRGSAPSSRDYDPLLFFFFKDYGY